jgi:hypothetical protein
MQCTYYGAFSHEEAMPPESLNLTRRTARILPFSVGLGFHHYTGCFSAWKASLKTRSILETIDVLWMGLDKSLGKGELLLNWRGW